MKKLLLFLGIALFSLPTFATPQLEKFSNAHGKTTIWISVPDEDRGDAHALRMENFVFHNNGESYKAKKVSVVNKTTLKVTFEYFNEFTNCSLTFTLNGQEQVLGVQRMLELRW